MKAELKPEEQKTVDQAYKDAFEAYKQKLAEGRGFEDGSLLQRLVDEAYLKEKEGNINFWTISDEDPEVRYWKGVWIKGFKAGKNIC